MKPPLVTRAFLAQRQGASQPVASASEVGASVVATAGRRPMGVLANALPAYYLAMQDGALLVMWDRSQGEATGPQVCLATISQEVLASLLASRVPLALTVPVP